MDVEQSEYAKAYLAKLKADYGPAYVAVITVAWQLYEVIVGTNAASDPFWTSGPERRLQQAYLLDGLVRAATAILKAEPHRVKPDPEGKVKNHIRDLATEFDKDNEVSARFSGTSAKESE